MAERYNFKYLPLVGKLPGKSMVEQTETAINELASVVYDNVGHVGNLAEEVQTANTNASNALDKATEALETSSRVYIKQIAAVDVNDYYDSELYYIDNDGSTNIPVRDSGFLEVKTNDDKTACEQVFIADSTGTPYYRHGRITEQTLGEETTYVVTWSSWYRVATTAFVQAELQDYLPLSGGTVTGDLDVTRAITCNSVTSNRVNVRSGSVAPVNTLQRSTAYSVDDIVYTSALNAKYYLLCVTAGTTSATMPSLSGAGSNTEVTDGTVVWRVQTITSQESQEKAAGLPVGFQYFQTNPNVPAGSLPLLGGEYSRTTYADLWAWVQTQQGYLIEESAWQAKAAANGGNVPFYSKGDGSTTFRVPALKCWVRGANSINEVGGYLAAGLPNITGMLQLRNGDNVGFELNNIKGAFSAADSTRITNYVDAYNYGQALFAPRLKFSAHDSSSIYGNSDTVQPESIVGMWVVKAYGTVSNVGSTDVSAIAQGLTEAETRISALENHSGEVLSGTVVAFSGTFEDGYPIDKNTGLADKKWHLCDGTKGTPDLRNRFIYGGNGTNNGTTGGEASVTLTVKTIPAHGHTGTTSTNGNHSHTVTTFKEHHKINGNSYDGYCTGSTDRTTSTAGNHQHSLNIDSTGGGQPHNNMPPYYTLAYIMKL